MSQENQAALYAKSLTYPLAPLKALYLSGPLRVPPQGSLHSAVCAAPMEEESVAARMEVLGDC